MTALGPEHVEMVRDLLGEAAAAAAACGDPSAVAYAALADVLDDPQVGYAPALVAAAVMVEGARPGGVGAVVGDLLDATDDTGHPLAEHCARELAGAHLQALLTVAAFSSEIGDTIPEDWT